MKRRPLHVSLRDWLMLGALGPIRIGATQSELVRDVGRPDQSDYPEHGQDTVWKYGDVELLFDSSSDPFRVYSIDMHAFSGVPKGGRKVKLDPWIVRNALPLETMLRALDEIGVAHRETVQPGGEVLQVILRDTPRVHLDFITRPGGWPIGLHGLWITQQ